MQNLNPSSFYFFSILIFWVVGCTTSSYRIANRDAGRVELAVTPDRVLLQCECVSDNKEVPCGFMMHVLDEEQTVVTVLQGNNLDERGCSERIKKIGNILRGGKRIYISGISYSIDDPRKAEEWKYTFPGLGTYNGNGRGMQFFAVANEHGGCYDAYYGERKPCPHGDEFPISRK